MSLSDEGYLRRYKCTENNYFQINVHFVKVHWKLLVKVVTICSIFRDVVIDMSYFVIFCLN